MSPSVGTKILTKLEESTGKTGKTYTRATRLRCCPTAGPQQLIRKSRTLQPEKMSPSVGTKILTKLEESTGKTGKTYTRATRLRCCPTADPQQLIRKSRTLQPEKMSPSVGTKILTKLEESTGKTG